MESLKIKDFGAIKNADVRLKKYNVFIGDTSSGKSTVAKLLAIFNNSGFWAIGNNNFPAFQKLLDKYNINFEFTKSTCIEYSKDNYTWTIKSNFFQTDYEDSDLISLSQETDLSAFVKKFLEKKNDSAISEVIEPFLRKRPKDDISFFELIKPLLLDSLYDKCIPVYIPAERLLISIFSNSVFSLLSVGVSIPECIKDFGSLYEKARIVQEDIEIDILKIKVSFSKEGDEVFLKEDNRTIKLAQSSSGILSVIPLWVVLNQYAKSEEKQIIVIEEPELNLFPTTQVSLIRHIVGAMKNSTGSIVFTTHSPYVLSTIDNLIFAKEIINKSDDKERTVSKIKKLVSLDELIDFEDVSSYYFSNDGEVRDIADRELRTLGSEHIDEASNESSYLFNELCKIEDDEL